MSEIYVTVDRLSPDTSSWAALLCGPGGRVTLHCSSDQKSVTRTAEEVARVLNVPLSPPRPPEHRWDNNYELRNGLAQSCPCGLMRQWNARQTTPSWAYAEFEANHEFGDVPERACTFVPKKA